MVHLARSRILTRSALAGGFCGACLERALSLTDCWWAHAAWREKQCRRPRTVRPGRTDFVVASVPHAPLVWASCMDDVAEALAFSAEPPAWLLDGVTAFIPKGEASETTVVLTMIAAELRPITPVQSVGKVTADLANQALVALVESSAAAPQRGCVKKQSIADNIINFEGELQV